MMTKKKVIIKKLKSFLESRREIIFAYLFGSFLDVENFKDIDLAVYIEEKDSISNNLFYQMELSSQIENIVKYPVDIVILNGTSSSIIFRASRGILLKNKNDNIRINLITSHWKMYWDFKSQLLYHMKERKHAS